MKTTPDALSLRLHRRRVEEDSVEIAELVDEGRDPSTAIVCVHGKGGNLFSLPFRMLAGALGGHAPTLYSLNMRCHDLGYSRDDLEAGDFPTGGEIAVSGGAWEDLESGWKDVEVAVDLAVSQGARRVYLVGHSSGAFYAVDFAARTGRGDGLILCSALTSNRMSLKRWFPDPAELREATERASAMVASGRGHELIPLRSWYFGISAAAFMQRLRESPDHFSAQLSSVRVPVGFVWGGKESRSLEWRALAESQPGGTWHEIPGADHHYTGGGARAEFVRLVRESVERFRARSAPPVDGREDQAGREARLRETAVSEGMEDDE